MRWYKPIPSKFIVSGGQLTGKPTATPRLTVGKLADMYPDSLQGIEDNTRLTLKIHLNHAKRLLKADTAIDTMTLADADRYARTRMKESHRGKLTQAYTARRELRTFHRAWTWAKAHGRTHSLPARAVDDVQLPKGRGRESFKNCKTLAGCRGQPP